MNTSPSTSFVTAAELRKMKQAGEKITVLTAYDASMTTQIEAAGVEVLLVGDSLGMVVQGHDSTLPVSMDDMIYHTQLVARVRQHALLISDMPFDSYNTPEQTFENARRLISEGGADMVKLEGGQAIIEIVRKLTEQNIPVCGHLGLLPQSIEELGGYKVQGREQSAADQMVADAKALQDAGADLVVLECVPKTLAKRITDAIEIPTIGIGAGKDCDGQVLVTYDLLGLTPGRVPSFVKDFVAAQSQGHGIVDALKAYVREVKDGGFPDESHSFE